MVIDTTPTLAGRAPDRAAHLRADANGLAALAARGATTVPLWRGKVCVTADGALVLLPPKHGVFADAAEPAAFLGLSSDGDGIFARDVSSWTPDETPATLGAFADPSRQRHPALPDGASFAELRSNLTLLGPSDAAIAATARGVLEWHRAHPRCARCGAPTDPVEAGWQRLCPECGARHFPRTDPVVIMLVTCGNAVLLGRSPGWPDGLHSLLAGFMEPGETIEAAVRREVAEEVGVGIGAVGYLASQPWPFPASLMIGCRATATTRELTPDPVEIAEATWLTREDVAAVFRGEHPAVRAPRSGAIAHHLLWSWLSDRL